MSPCPHLHLHAPPGRGSHNISVVAMLLQLILLLPSTGKQGTQEDLRDSLQIYGSWSPHHVSQPQMGDQDLWQMGKERCSPTPSFKPKPTNFLKKVFSKTLQVRRKDMIDLMLDCIKEGEQPVATSSNHYEFYYLIEQQALLIKALFATYVGLYPWLH